MIDANDVFRFLIALGTTLSGVAVYIAKEGSKRVDNLERRLDECLDKLWGKSRDNK